MLLVGTLAEQVGAARRALASHDCEFAVVSQEDIVDASTPAVADGSGMLIINGDRDGRSWLLKARIDDWKQFPDALLSWSSGDEAGNDKSIDHSVAELRELVAGLPGVVFRCGIDAGGKVDFMNERVNEICGYDRRKFLRRNSLRLLALLPRVERRQLRNAVKSSASSGQPFSMEHRIRCTDGSMRWVWHRGCVYRNRREYPELESFVVDITERKSEEQQLAYLASHDPLTGVANRAMFLEQVVKSMRRADRHDEMVACLFLDLDRFKRVNDSFGHAFGDELLQQVATRLKRCIRGNDLIGRLGGDEFAVLLDGIDEPQDAEAAARKIIEELDRPYVIGDQRFAASASIGISCYPGDALDCPSLLRNADAAMYSVKSGGRHGYRFFSAGMSEHAFQTLAVSNALRDAIATGSVQLRFQPRVDLRTGRTVAYETFARWESDEFGRISPARFISLAEDTGLMDALGKLILRKACTQAVAWNMNAQPSMRVSVNISSQQFRSGEFVNDIESVLQSSGLEPGRLELEISEATLMQDACTAIDILQQLRLLGVKLSVSGFGTGYSSLQLLQDFHLDYLKMDRSVMQDAPHDADQVAVAEAMIAMAQRLDLRVVAEGIETEAQSDFVRAAGCDEGQGYLYGRPLPVAEISATAERCVH